MEPFDLIVIGGGVAGTAAALAAAAGGRRVGLIRASSGATALAAGGWTGPLPDPLARALAAVGHPYESADARFPHPAGDLRAFDAAPPSHAGAAASVDRDDALVCGIAGLASFRARPLARLWSAATGAAPAATVLELDGTPRAGWSPVALAATIEREPGILTDAVVDAVRAHGAGRVVLPAIIGLDRSEHVRRAVEAAVGVPVGEALGVPPSVPGWRLERALGRALEAAGVAVVRARVRDRSVEGRRVRSVTASPSATDDGTEEDAVRLEANAFVLATGAFIGGGITADGEFAEAALGCPVWVEHLDEVHERSVPLTLTAPDRGGAQPLLEAGVRTDDEGRPIDRWGDVVYENVRVAGTVRTGREAAAPGLGHAAADGWRAGESAALTEAAS